MLMTTNLKTKHNSERSAAPAPDYQSSDKPTSHRKRKRKRISEEGRYIRLEFSLLKVCAGCFRKLATCTTCPVSGANKHRFRLWLSESRFKVNGQRSRRIKRYSRSHFFPPSWISPMPSLNPITYNTILRFTHYITKILALGPARDQHYYSYFRSLFVSV